MSSGVEHAPSSEPPKGKQFQDQSADRSSDEKEAKKTARMMMSMVLKINADNFRIFGECHL
jgi:hypothetical protein